MANNTLRDLRNSLEDTQPHPITVNYIRICSCERKSLCLRTLKRFLAFNRSFESLEFVLPASFVEQLGSRAPLSLGTVVFPTFLTKCIYS